MAATVSQSAPVMNINMNFTGQRADIQTCQRSNEEVPPEKRKRTALNGDEEERARLDQEEMARLLEERPWAPSPSWPSSWALFDEVQRHLKHQYTVRQRIESNDYLGLDTSVTFSPKLQFLSSKRQVPLENSRHDIFNLPTNNQKQPSRIFVSGRKKSKRSALSHSLAFDWATSSSSSPAELKYKMLFFELELSKVTEKQDIAHAIKDQLLKDMEVVQVEHIQAMLEQYSDSITIVLNGLESLPKGYQGDISQVISGEKLSDTTVLVTTDIHGASRLKAMNKDFAHIEMLCK